MMKRMEVIEGQVKLLLTSGIAQALSSQLSYQNLTATRQWTATDQQIPNQHTPANKQTAIYQQTPANKQTATDHLTANQQTDTDHPMASNALPTVSVVSIPTYLLMYCTYVIYGGVKARNLYSNVTGFMKRGIIHAIINI